jgi:predicted ribosome quality control (RQC) complex YloA/Tae2 family protein
MNDKEAFGKWCKNYFGEDATIINVPSYFIHTWQAAVDYARQENTNNNSEIINRLNQENEKLREALEEIKNSYAHSSRVLRISERLLKEVGGK